MAKKQSKKQPKETIKEEKPKELSYQERIDYQKHVERLNGIFSKMRFLDLQKECILRGMIPEEMVASDLGKLQSWLIKNWDLSQLPSRLDDFDKWRELELEKIGKGGEPFLRLGYIGQINEETDDFDIKKPSSIKKATVKRERDKDMGIFLGTKKALTFSLTKEGKSIDDIISLVTEKFPEAQEKSIKIWIKKCKSSMTK